MLWQEIFVVILMILLNGVFAMAELAIFSSRRARLQQMALDGKRGASTAIKLLDDPTGFLSTIQVGITLIAILLGAYGEATFAEGVAAAVVDLPYVGPYARTVASTFIIVLMAFTSIMMGELIPKRLALRDPENIACALAGPMRLVSYAAHPAVWFLRKTTELVLRLFAAPSIDDPSVTEDEVKSLIAEGTRAGVFEPAEKDMLEGVLRVADRTVRSIMTPRPDVVWLDLNDPMATIYETIANSGHSRFPVACDDVDDIVGVVHSKDLLEQLRTDAARDQSKSAMSMGLKDIAREPIYLHESTPVLTLLESFRSSAVHVAIVLDEHGTVQGIVTPADILVAIAGEMPERGEDEPSAVQRGDGSWLLDGQMSVHEVERTLAVRGLSAYEHEYTTLAGFVLTQLGHIPVPGEAFDWKNWRFEVVDLDGRRIDKVMVLPRSANGQVR